MRDLPLLYTELKPTRLPKNDTFVPPIPEDMNSTNNPLTKDMGKEYDWL